MIRYPQTDVCVPVNCFGGGQGDGLDDGYDSGDGEGCGWGGTWGDGGDVFANNGFGDGDGWNAHGTGQSAPGPMALAPTDIDLWICWDAEQGLSG